MDMYSIQGRYYSVVELDSVCPAGWNLPTIEDWINYFTYLTETKYPKVNLEINVYGERKFSPKELKELISEKQLLSPLNISGYYNKIDLWAEGNLLNLKQIGRVEGGEVQIGYQHGKYWDREQKKWLEEPFADFWTRANSEVTSDKTHAHVSNIYTVIHSHDIHLKPKQKRKLRKFMVRCVKDYHIQ